MADEKVRFTELEDEYSPKDLRRERRLRRDLQQQEKKLGPQREIAVVPGHIQGPLRGRDHYRFKEAIDGLEHQVREIPELGEQDAILKRVRDEFGNVFLALRIRRDGTEAEEWYHTSFYNPDDPNLSIPDDGGITPGGAPTVHPVTIGGGSWVYPGAGGASAADQTVSDTTMRVTVFPAGSVTTAQQQVTLPDGYGLGDLQFRISELYQAAAGSGTIIMGMRVKIVDADAAPAAFSGAWTEVTLNGNAGSVVKLQSDVSTVFSPEGTAVRGGAAHIELRRDGVTDTLAQAAWLREIQVFYEKDKHSDRVST